MPVPTPQFACDIPTLVARSNFFLDPQAGESERDAVEIYAKIKNLAAIGGTDYSSNLNQLLQDSRAYKVLDKNQRKAISTYISLMNAIDDGATLAGVTGGSTDAVTNISALMSAATCYKCLGTEDRKNLIEYLKCAMNASVKPD